MTDEGTLSRIIKNVQRNEINVFMTNLFVTVILIFFMKSYKSSNTPFLPYFIIIILCVIICTFVFMVYKNSKLKKELFPIKLLGINFIITAAIGSIFFTQIGILNFIALLILSFVFYETEHIIYTVEKNDRPV